MSKVYSGVLHIMPAAATPRKEPEAEKLSSACMSELRNGMD